MTYFLNFWALAHAKSTHVAIFIYLQPVVASAVGWLWFHEIITLRTVLSSVLIFLGLLISISKDGGLELLTAPIKKVWQYTTNHKN
ncbi:MAG: DMT family transporter [Deltaproteobacteria bacterium]|nr:DMT family transporter [Deltaproteobacteria bacterium]